MSEFVDGHRWPQKAVSPDAPSRPETPSTAPDQQGGTGADDLPPFEVQAIYRHGMVGILFDPDHIPLLMRHPLFAASADQLRAAVVDIEQEIEDQILTTRERHISGGLR